MSRVTVRAKLSLVRPGIRGESDRPHASIRSTSLALVRCEVTKRQSRRVVVHYTERSRARMKILITGNLGYVGPWVTRQLRRRYPEASLVGVDVGYFAHCLTDACRVPEALLDAQYYADIRNLPPALFDGVDAIVHLAAISNDPMGNAFEEVTLDVNHRAGVELARQAKAAGVRSVRLRVELQRVRFGGRPAAHRTVRRRSTDGLREIQGAHRAGAGGTRRIEFSRVLPAVRDRVRDERPVAPGSRAERLRRLRAVDWPHHRPERRHALEAADQRQGHGARD